jgi:RecB family endonuclease NucS
MIVILARASARYQGRIDAELSLGDVCILIRDIESGGDGSVLIHDMQMGIPPRNWMPAGSSMQVTEGGYVFEHEKRGEKLEVWVETIYASQSHYSQLTSKLAKLGAEREFSDRLALQVQLLGDLVLVAREWRTPCGPVDLLCQDVNECPVAIEVKRRAIDPNAVWQMRRYLHAIGEDPAWKDQVPRGILVAPSLQKAAQRLIEQFDDLEFIRVTFDQLKELEVQMNDQQELKDD